MKTQACQGWRLLLAPADYRACRQFRKRFKKRSPALGRASWVLLASWNSVLDVQLGAAVLLALAARHG
ncbi:hypothetical protein ACFPOA_01360, partial [Lysobacter niabensis]